MTDYERIEKAIEYIHQHFQEQPQLERVAKEVYLSPFHFQRLFKKWAGVSPKKFLQYISICHAKKLLEQDATLEAASFEAGLSGTGRLHDLFIHIEGMTPGEYKNDGQNLKMLYSFSETPFGTILIASTPKGICHLSFIDNKKKALDELRSKWKNASFREGIDSQQKNVFSVFIEGKEDLKKIQLHLKGTDFQLKVWEALLKIPAGHVSSYKTVAAQIHQPAAVRAVGSAVGDNPVAYLIPCHRVIRSTGLIGDYHWGSVRKTAILGWESSQVFGEN
ncbi:MAG TPA: methylated-DNA--[protein]-cysteine S-methyltransferase [Puia sp.]|nr:methylated-DNA--[protein]-cysteine S-methyltransferase [Puia sp.]